MARRDKPSEVKLNLAAMLDMAFQLLAFFVMTFKPDPVEGQIQLRLPPPEAIAQVKTNQQAGQDTSNTNPVEGVETLIISIYSRPDGGIKSVAVGEGQVGEDSPDKIRALESRLRVILDDKDNPFKQVILQVGSRIRYDELMRVIDTCTRQKLPSGEALTKLSFVELPEGNAGGP